MNRRVFTLSFLASLMGAGSLRQAISEELEQVAMGGSATGGVHQAVYDAKHRPITAGGFVKHGPVIFEDVTRQAGLGSWTHRMGSPEKKFIIEVNGSGVGLIDYDNDGWLDIYLVNGSTYKAMDGKEPQPRAALFHNNRDGTFTDVAESAGVLNERWGFGVAVGDFDNDGWPDMYVTNFGKNRLYKNNHDGTFTDVAEKAGVALGNWSTGPTFGDYDGDGLLDLFVPGYVSYNLNHPPAVGSNQVVSNTCRFRGVSVFCGPRGLLGEHDHLFHNNGDGTFTDVSREAGVYDAPRYYGLTSLFVDLNGNGNPDLLVADDSTPNYLYRNKGKGTFENYSYESGFAVNGEGREIASMGIAVGDYLNNGRLDIAVTDFSDDYDVLYRNDGSLYFNDVSAKAGIAKPTIPFLGWGVGFADFDNDGWKDLFVVNGHVYPQVDQHKWGTSFAQRPLLFHNMRNGTFELTPATEGTGLADVITGRGAAFGDLFNRGKIDVVINNLDGAPTVLRNVSGGDHHWVKFRLIGGPRCPRDAIGTSVFLTAGGTTQRGDVLSGGSYASSNDLRVHFGIGKAKHVDKVEIHWRGGQVEKVNVPSVDRTFTVKQGHGIVHRSRPAKHSTNFR